MVKENNYSKMATVTKANIPTINQMVMANIIGKRGTFTKDSSKMVWGMVKAYGGQVQNLMKVAIWMIRKVVKEYTIGKMVKRIIKEVFARI